MDVIFGKWNIVTTYFYFISIFSIDFNVRNCNGFFYFINLLGVNMDNDGF